MATDPKSTKSNADRGLEKHVDPKDPTGPLLTHLPPLSVRKPPKPKATKDT